MLIPEEYIEILVELGLTRTEAKVYIVLLSLKSATARNIQRQSNVARQDVYRILSELEEKDLIEKVIAKPAKFRPIPANGAISILLQRRKEKNRQLRKKAIQQFRNFKIDFVETVPLKIESEFILLSKSETNPTAHTDKLGKAVNNAQKNVLSLTTFQFFKKVMFNDAQSWEKAVKRGVKFKFIICGIPKDEKFELDLGPVLKNTDCFKIRWTHPCSQACALLVDENEAFCRIGHNVDSPVLWSADPNFVAMIKDYLETKWKSLEHSRKQQILSNVH